MMTSPRYSPKKPAASLKNADGNSIEEGWNNLVMAAGLHQATEADVFLEPPPSKKDSSPTHQLSLDPTFVNDADETITRSEIDDMAMARRAWVERTDEGFLVDGELFRPVKQRTRDDTDIDDLHFQAKAIRATAQSDPARVDLDELYEILGTPTASPPAHATAAQALLVIARDRDDVPDQFVDSVHQLLSRPSLDADVLLLRCLRQIAQAHPTTVLDTAATTISEMVTLDDSAETVAALGCCVELVSEQPGALLDLTPLLAALLDSENRQIRRNAMFILAGIAREYPEELKPLVPQLITDIDARAGNYQINALSALGYVTSAFPSPAEPAIEPLAKLAETASAPKVRGNAVGLLADVAKEQPEAVEEHLRTVIDSLYDTDEYVRGNAVAAGLHLGNEHPKAATEAIPALVELLDDPSPVVCRNVCKALGQLEATVTVEQLRSMAKSDPDEGVRSLAEWAIDQVT